MIVVDGHHNDRQFHFSSPHIVPSQSVWECDKIQGQQACSNGEERQHDRVISSGTGYKGRCWRNKASETRPQISYTGCLGQAIYYTPRSSAITGYSALSATCCTVKLVSTQLLAKDRVHSTSARLCDQEVELISLLGKQEGRIPALHGDAL